MYRPSVKSSYKADVGTDWKQVPASEEPWLEMSGALFRVLPFDVGELLCFRKV